MRVFAFVLSSKPILSTFLRHMFETELFLMVNLKILKVFHKCFGLPIFSLNLFLILRFLKGAILSKTFKILLTRSVYAVLTSEKNYNLEN